MNRKMVSAGRFYPDTREQLTSNLESLFNPVDVEKPAGKTRAVIVPHAGYTFSGVTAATGFKQLKTTRYDNIFLLGSSHHVYMEGASVYNAGDYETPLGIARVNTAIGSELIRSSQLFTFKSEAHENEHSLEVQVPFLQYIFRTDELNLVPIILGTQEPKSCKELAEVLRPWFTKNNLFVISSDFSHYPEYEAANMVDKVTGDGLMTKSPELFLSAIEENKSQSIANLHTCACGWTSILTLLYLVEDDINIEIQHLDYRNSGDSKYGGKDQVVGYHAFAITENSKTSAIFSSSGEMLTLR